jgi:hypothetical protein
MADNAFGSNPQDAGQMNGGQAGAQIGAQPDTPAVLSPNSWMALGGIGGVAPLPNSGGGGCTSCGGARINSTPATGKLANGYAVPSGVLPAIGMEAATVGNISPTHQTVNPYVPTNPPITPPSPPIIPPVINGTRVSTHKGDCGCGCNPCQCGCAQCQCKSVESLENPTAPINQMLAPIGTIAATIGDFSPTHATNQMDYSQNPAVRSKQTHECCRTQCCCDPYSRQQYIPSKYRPFRPGIVPPLLPANPDGDLPNNDYSGDISYMPGINVKYDGGPLITNVQVVCVFWGQEWKSGALYDVSTKLIDFFKTIVDSQFMDMLSEYSQPGYPIGHGSYRGSIYNGVGLPIAPIVTKEFPIGHTDVEDMLIPYATSGGYDLANTVFFVYLPPGYEGTLSTLDHSCTDWSGYHWEYDDNTVYPLYFAVVPYCFSENLPSSSDVTNVVNSLTIPSSHELAEAITDPYVGLFGGSSGWTVPYDNNVFPHPLNVRPVIIGAYISPIEVADICSDSDADLIGVYPDHSYAVSKIYSRRQGKCTTTPWPQLAVPETATGAPAAATVPANWVSSTLQGEVVAIAWTGTDTHYNVNIGFVDPGIGFTDPTKEILTYLPQSKQIYKYVSAMNGPAMAVGNGIILLAWLDNNLDLPRFSWVIGTPDVQSHIISWSTKINHLYGTLSLDSPALLFANGVFYIAYVDHDSHELRIMSTIDGSIWQMETPPGITNLDRAVVLTFADGQIQIMWTDTSSREIITAAYSPGQPATPAGGRGFADLLSSWYHPALAFSGPTSSEAVLCATVQGHYYDVEFMHFRVSTVEQPSSSSGFGGFIQGDVNPNRGGIDTYL